jgi:hypothetical protein
MAHLKRSASPSEAATVSHTKLGIVNAGGPVPQVRVRSLDANLGPLLAHFFEGRNSTPPRTPAFLPTFFITFFSYAHHSLAPQSVRRYLDSAPSRTAPVSRDERISGRKLFIAL